jgi:hypothetical protein
MRRIAAMTRNPAMIALVAALAITGCASKKAPNNAGDLGLNANGNNAAPGSSQDFTLNVGDRILFDTDSSMIRADAQQTLAKQAQWLNQYRNYKITDRRPCRRTRHPRVQYRARCPPRCRHPRLPHRSGRWLKPPAHHFLRQGTPSRALRRRLLPDPEPPRGYGSRRPGQLSLSLNLQHLAKIQQSGLSGPLFACLETV